MEKGKHILLEDIESIFKNESNGAVNEEEMLMVLKHLATCGECVERVKAHRRLDILLNQWTPELHGQAFKKMEALKKIKDSKQADKAENENEVEDDDDANEDDFGHNHSGNDYEYDDDGDCDCNGEEDDNDSGECSCGHEHDHGYDHEHNPYKN